MAHPFPKVTNLGPCGCCGGAGSGSGHGYPPSNCTICGAPVGGGVRVSFHDWDPVTPQGACVAAGYDDFYSAAWLDGRSFDVAFYDEADPFPGTLGESDVVDGPVPEVPYYPSLVRAFQVVWRCPGEGDPPDEVLLTSLLYGDMGGWCTDPGGGVLIPTAVSGTWGGTNSDPADPDGVIVTVEGVVCDGAGFVSQTWAVEVWKTSPPGATPASTRITRTGKITMTVLP